MTRETVLGYLQALTAIVFWSFNVIFATAFVTKLTPIEFAFGRWFFAALILLPMAYSGIKENFRFFLKHWFWLLMLAVSGIVVDNTLIYLAAQTISAVDIGLLNTLGPVFLCFLAAFFLRTLIRPLQWVGIFLALSGACIIVTKGDLTRLFEMRFAAGDYWILLNAFCFGVYSFLQYKRPPFIDQRTVLGATVFIGILILFPIFLFQTSPDRILRLGLESYSVLLYLGIFNSVLAYLAWNSSLIKLGPVKAGVIYYLLPLLILAEAVFFLNETISGAEIVGGLCVVFGIACVSLLSRKKQTK